MTELSPTAQAVLDAMYEVNMDFGDENALLAAAVLRALATRGEAAEIRMAPGMSEFDEVIRVSNICAIAAELDGAK